MGVVRKQGVLSLETHDVLLASHKLLSDNLEAIAKKFEAQEVAKLSTNIIVCDFFEQSHKSGACLLSGLGLSDEQVK